MNTHMKPKENLEDFAQQLEASDDYRVLRRLEIPSSQLPVATEGARLGLYIDVETTGLDKRQDEILELAIVPFRYDKEGQIFQRGKGWAQLRQPSKPIDPKVTAIHGITNEMVEGKSIDPDKVASLIAGADIIVTHNAAFDRPFLERFCPAFATKGFGCSMSEVDWKGEGFEGVKLFHLALESGFFYDKHRALNDCHAGLELLSKRLPNSGVPAFAKLLERARQPVWRIRAVGAHFDAKDVLKSRGYKWQEERPGVPKAWYIDVLEEDHAAELRFLRAEIYRREVHVPALRLDARDRFSVRADVLG